MKGEQLGVEDFLRLTSHRQNLQCGMIAGVRADKCAESTLELAKQNLKSFSVVGICERFEESLVLTALTFDWEIPFYENRKVTKTCPEIDPAAVELIKEHNRLDLELYRFGNQLFQTSLEEKKHAVEEGLARLRMLPKPSPIESWYNSALGTGRFLITKIASGV